MPAFNEHRLLDGKERELWLSSLVVAPDGRLAVGDTRGTVRLLDVSGAVSRQRASLGDPLVWSEDGRSLAIADGCAVALWTPVGDVLRPLGRHRQGVTGALFLPDGAVVSASADRTLRCWDPRTGEELGRRIHGTAEPDSPNWREALWIGALARSADGRLLATAGNDGAVRLWETSTGREVGAIEGARYLWPSHGTSTVWIDVDISPDGRRIAALLTDGRVGVWDLVDRRSIGAWDLGSSERTWSGRTARFVGDRLLVVGASGWDRGIDMPHPGTIDLLDPERGEVELHADVDRLQQAAMTRDGRLVAITDRALLVSAPRP